MDVLPILGGLACLLTLVTVVGHALWVLVARLFAGDTPAQQVGQPSAPPATAPAQICPRCGLPLGGPQCAVCNWPRESTASEPRRVSALDALARQTAALDRLGLLDSELHQNISRLIDDERQRLAAISAPPVPAEEPIAAELVAAEPVEEEPASPLAQQQREIASPIPVAERARDYAARQESRQAEPVQQPAEPAGGWTDWLAAFMEERNMRWGELIGGLLIVCCSVALVVSFWSEIAERPWLKFVLFNGVTAGLFGVGFYSEYRWRLHTSSQGLLIIANLLVPLNFLAIAAFSSGPTANAPLTIAGEAISTVVFTALVYYAGRILVSDGAAWLAAGVILPCIAQLVVGRYVDSQSSLDLLAALAGATLAAYLAVNGWLVRRSAEELVIGERQVNTAFKFLGLTTFATLLPLGLLVLKTERPLDTLRELPMIVGLLGVAPLSLGLMLWQKLAGRQLVTLRTAGASVAVAGALLLVAGLALGWPHPRAMLPAALIEFAVFTFVAWRFVLPAAHVLAACCLAIGYLLGIYLADHRIDWTVEDPRVLGEVLVSGDTGMLLAPLVLAYVAAAIGLARRAATRRILGGTAAAMAAISVALLARFGFGMEGDPIGAAPVFWLYAAGCLVASARSRRASIARIGSLLMLAASLQSIVFRWGARLELTVPVITAVLLFATLTIAIAAALRYFRWAGNDSPLGRVLARSSFAGSLAAALALGLALDAPVVNFQAGHWLWTSLIWLAIGLTAGWPLAWTLMQGGLSIATVFLAAIMLERQPWFSQSPRPWLDPRSLSAFGVSLAVLNLAWTAIRGVCRSANQHTPPPEWSLAATRLLTSPWLAVDRVVTGGLVALVVTIGCYAALPGSLLELSPRMASATVGDYQWLDIPHQHAAGWAGWLLLVGVALLLIAMLRERGSRGWLECLILCLFVAAPLTASRWESDVAVASAWRWLAVGLLVAGSAVVWGRAWITRQIGRLGWRNWPLGNDFASYSGALVLVLGALPTFVMATYVSARAVLETKTTAGFPDDVFAAAIILALSALIVAAIVTVGRSATGKQFATLSTPPRSFDGASQLSALALVLIVAPLAALATHYVAVALAGYPILGPRPGSFFDRIGLASSYATPVATIALVLAGYGLRERSSGFSLAAGVTLNVAATVAFLLADWPTAIQFEAPLWIRLVELNAAVAAGCGLAWLGLFEWTRRRAEPRETFARDLPFDIQIAIGPGLWMLVAGWTWSELFWRPRGGSGSAPLMHAELADVWGCASLALVVASVALATWLAVRRTSMLLASAALCDLGGFRGNVAGAARHRKLALLQHATGWPHGDRDRLVGAIGARPLSTAIARRECHFGVASRMGRVAGDVYRCACRARVDRQSMVASRRPGLRGSCCGAGVGLDLPTASLFLRRGAAGQHCRLAGLVRVAAHARPERICIRQHHSARATRASLADHRAAGDSHSTLADTLERAADAPVGHVRCLGRVGVCRRGWSLGRRDGQSSACPSRRAAMVRSRGDPRRGAGLFVGRRGAGCSRRAVFPGLRGLRHVARQLRPRAQLAAVDVHDGHGRLRGIDQLSVEPPRRTTGRRRVVRNSARQAGELAGLNWLVPANVALVMAIVAMTCTVELTEHVRSLRVLASQATLAQVISLALLARGDRRGLLQRGALVLGAIGSVLFGCAWLEIGVTLTPLNALATASTALAVVATLYGLGLVKLLRGESDWLPQARTLTPWLAAACAAAIIGTLAAEIHQFTQTGTVDMIRPAIVAVAFTLFGLFAAALAAAILPGRDPLDLSERGRTLYVYGAEVILALLFVHIRLTMPWLFSGFFQQFWPLVVMAIAFLGVGAAELFRRRQQYVLAEPLENTGVLLPVLPVVGYWAANSQVHYSLLLVCVGVLYGGLSIARRSFGFGILAALAANGGLWYFLQRQEGLGILAHPQIWLIPPALCLLAAAYLNRRQLSDAQMTSLRYLCSMTIYVSSTADVFLNGVAQAPWLPLVLGALSLAGIAAGILLRVRAFLFLGTAFLGLALFTIIWHAAVDRDQTWIWYVSGLVAGVLIVAGFTLVEKKRQDVLAVLEKIKAWEG